MSNSTNAGSFSSYDQNLSAGVDETPSFDRAFSGQQILDVDHELLSPEGDSIVDVQQDWQRM
jgi:hypothetical protein